MPVYRAQIEGVEPILVRAESAAKAKDQIVTLDALTGEEMADALEAGEKIHKAGDPIKLVAAAKPEPEPTAGAGKGAKASGEASGGDTV